MPDFVSRAGAKLEHALTALSIDPANKICADLGCSTGGFTDCLLQHGAAKVYAVDTGYGVLDWKLRKDHRVIVMERTNAMHVELPEPVSLVTIDVAWTKQRYILPAAGKLLSQRGQIVTLDGQHVQARERREPGDRQSGATHRADHAAARLGRSHRAADLEQASEAATKRRMVDV